MIDLNFWYLKEPLVPCLRVCMRIGCAFRGSRVLKSSFLLRGIENDRSLHYGHAYQLNVRAVKLMDACVLRKGVKTEMLSPRNDRTTKRNINCLLAATVDYTTR
jgi:hypothetical protein